MQKTLLDIRFIKIWKSNLFTIAILYKNGMSSILMPFIMLACSSIIKQICNICITDFWIPELVFGHVNMHGYGGGKDNLFLLGHADFESCGSKSVWPKRNQITHYMNVYRDWLHIDIPCRATFYPDSL